MPDESFVKSNSCLHPFPQILLILRHILCSLAIATQPGLLVEAEEKRGEKIQSRPQDCSFSVVTKLQMELNKTCRRKLVGLKLDEWEKVTLSSECQIVSYRKCFKVSRSNLRSW